MRTSMMISAAAAAVVAITLFDTTPTDAAPRNNTFRAMKAPAVRHVRPRITHKPLGKISKNPSATFSKKGTRSSFVKKGTSGNVLKKGTAHTFVKKAKIGGGTLNLRRLPTHKAASGTGLLKGRLLVPQNIKPKLTLTHAPPLKFRPRFAPFLQRHWKSAFFWVAVAGIGYVTVPALYYDRFYTCVSVDDPIYDDCLYILSYATIEEEEIVRVPMPASASYRYQAKAPARSAADCSACKWENYVERKWNQSFSWVKVPEVGNVSVPDAYYDRFQTYAAANPPDYPQACKVLKDAAAAPGEKELVRISMPEGSEYRYEADSAPSSECKSCTLEPFVERKWNKEYVWVQVPDTGNVTVPEDAYDRFYSYASAEPPNYPAACKVLVEAAAADTVITTGLDTRREE